jgi:hypothetical protein
MSPNFVFLNATLPDVARVVAAMLQARDAVESRSPRGRENAIRDGQEKAPPERGCKDY